MSPLANLDPNADATVDDIKCENFEFGDMLLQNQWIPIYHSLNGIKVWVGILPGITLLQLMLLDN